MKNTKVFKTVDKNNHYHLWNYQNKTHILEAVSEEELVEWLVNHPEYTLIN